MGQGHALLHPRPGARATGLPGAGSVLLIFLMPPNNGMNPTCSSLRSSQAGYAHRWIVCQIIEFRPTLSSETGSSPVWVTGFGGLCQLAGKGLFHLPRAITILHLN